MGQGIYPISQLPSVKIARHGFFMFLMIVIHLTVTIYNSPVVQAHGQF